MGDDLASVVAQVDEARSLARVQRDFERARRVFVEALRRLDALTGAEGTGGKDVALVRARILGGLAACEMERGVRSAAEALGLLSEAERYALFADRSDAVAWVRGHRGLLLLRSGDLPRARRELDAAVAGLVDPHDLVPVLLNRGALHLEQGSVGAAIDDFERCRTVADGTGTVFRSMAEHNLGYALYLRGDLPAALRAMEAAAASAPPEHAGVGLMDRAVVLYEAGLVTDAARALERAADILAEHGAEVDLARVRWARARCLVLLERFAEAADVARAARELFAHQSNDGWAASAELVELEALLARVGVTDGDGVGQGRGRGSGTGSGTRSGGGAAGGADGLDEVRRRAAAIALRRPSDRVAVPARVLQAEAAVRSGLQDEASRALAAVRRRRRGQQLSVRIQYEAVAALLAFDVGDRRRGLAAVRRGLDLLNDHRARLGALDTVTAAALHGVRLAVVDVVAGLRTGRADAFFDAVERGRATFAGAGRVVPHSEPETAELVTGARRALEAALAEDSSPARDAHVREARRLQEAARQRSWTVSGGQVEAPRAARARGVRALLRTAAPADRATVVSFAVVHGRLYATWLDADGQGLLRLGDFAGVAEQVQRVRADLAVLANVRIPASMRAAASGSARRALGALDERLLRPLEAQGDLHVVARHLLLAVPWTALPSRRGRRTWVNSWVEPRTAGPRPAEGRALVVVGPGLATAAAETRGVAGTWPAARVLDGAAATCASTVAEAQHATVVHLAAHGTHEPDNPLFSSLRLADGPLFAYELDGTDLRGATVVLSACEVGRSTPRVGGEPMGLTSVLLRHGAGAVVASVSPLRDDVASRLMPALHAGLRDGLRPAEALARAAAKEPEPVPLVCFGPLAT